ncbi:MAG TPA: hypothetical protein VJL54_04905 [Nitrososphaera sp.]|nr:hypothetical protein [Nitrososphaera sp.]
MAPAVEYIRTGFVTARCSMSSLSTQLGLLMLYTNRWTAPDSSQIQETKMDGEPHPDETALFYSMAELSSEGVQSSEASARSLMYTS